MSPKAVLLLSGGVDSATAGAMTAEQGFDLFALTVDYGQRHRAELDAARRMADSLGVVRHVVLPVDLRRFGGSALTDDVPVPKHTAADAIGEEIPATYVPARNTIMLSLALGWAEVVEAESV